MAATAVRATTRHSEWFESWFDSSHYHKLYAYRDDTEAARFLDELMARLEPHRGARVLDLGCGAGRHSTYLASKGLQRHGHGPGRQQHPEAKKSERPWLRFLQHDMRVPFGRDAFDYVFNFFTSFGYFEQPDEHLAVVRNMATSLRPGGRLVLDYLNVRLRRGAADARRGQGDRRHYLPADALDRRPSFLQADRRRGRRRRTARIRGARRQVHAGRLRAHVRASRPEHRGGARRLPPEPLRFPDLASDDSGGEEERNAAGMRILARSVLADATERLRRDAEVRREHELRHAQRDGRIFFQELLVALLGRRAERIDDPLILRRGVPLQTVAKAGGVARNALDRPLMRGRIEQEEIRVLDGVDEIRRRRSRRHAWAFPDPPVLRRELHDVLFALGIDDVFAQAPAGNECAVRRRLTSALEELAGAKRPGEVERFQERELFLGERPFTLEVGPQSVKFRHRFERIL